MGDSSAMAEEKYALITGGTRGLGREIARTLSARGFKLALLYLENKAQAQAALKEIGGRGILIRADVAQSAGAEVAASKVSEEWPGLDALINCAAITADAPLIRQKEEDWDRVVGVNLKGCFNMTRALAPLIAKRRGGHIVNISSASGLRGKAGQAAYSASKAAVLGLTVSLAAELAVENIRVNAIVPGYMNTEMGRAAPRAMAEAKEASLLGVLSEPREAAGLVAWLLSTSTVTGRVLSVDSRPGGAL